MTPAIEELEKLASEMWLRSPELYEHILSIATRLRTEERDAATRHARAIEALRGCVDWMEGHFCPEDGQCEFCRVGRERVAAARSVIAEEAKA